jgi:hypothetical protein
VSGACSVVKPWNVPTRNFEANRAAMVTPARTQMLTDTHTHARTHTCTCTCTQTDMPTHRQSCSNTHTDTHTHAHSQHTATQTLTHARRQTHTDTDTRTHARAHTHTRHTQVTRARWLPLIYNATREAYETGTGPLRPMYYEYPEETMAYANAFRPPARTCAMSTPVVPLPSFCPPARPPATGCCFVSIRTRSARFVHACKRVSKGCGGSVCVWIRALWVHGSGVCTAIRAHAHAHASAIDIQ